MRVPTHEEAISPRFERDDRFEVADHIIGQELSQLRDDGVICGAFRFGSASFGDEGPGSDRDLIVAYPDPPYATEPGVLQALHEVAKRTYSEAGVPLEITCASLSQLQVGEHTLTRRMLEWLRRQPGLFPHDVIGLDFVQTIADPRELPPTDFAELDRWLARSHTNLQREYLQGAYFKPADLLGHIFSMPHMATRKVIDALKAAGYEAGQLDDLSKEGIATALFGIYDASTTTCVLYDEVVRDARKFYEEFLPQAKSLSQEEYDQIIYALIEDNLPKAIHLLTRLQMIQRLARAHLRLRPTLYEEHGIISLTDGDETEDGEPFLPEYLRRYMQAVDLNGSPVVSSWYAS